jgi:glutamine synthetase
MGSGFASADAFLQAHPELQFIDLLIPDMNGIVRGKRVDPSTLPKVFERGIAMPASIFALNIQGTTVEETGLGLDIGEAFLRTRAWCCRTSSSGLKNWA